MAVDTMAMVTAGVLVAECEEGEAMVLAIKAAVEVA